MSRPITFAPPSAILPKPLCSTKVALVLGLFVAGGLGAATDVGADPTPALELQTRRWTAHWISHPAAPKSDNGLWLFRRTLDLPVRPARFVVHATADARYQLWVNGERVCRGPQASDPKEWRYESVDLAPWLRPGANVIAAQVVGYGNDAPFASMGWRTGFLLQGDTVTERTIDTDASWKVVRVEGYKIFHADRAALHTFIVVSPGEQLDAAKYPWGWQSPGFDATVWDDARTFDYGKPVGWGLDLDYWLKPRSIPLLEETPERLARVVRASGITLPSEFPAKPAGFTVRPHSQVAILLDRGQLTNAYPQLTVSGGRGSTITLRYAEALLDPHGRKGNRNESVGRVLRGVGDRFFPDGGEHRFFEPLDFRTYRYLQLDIETAAEPLTVEDFSGRFTGYPFRENASFTSDDPTLTQMWEVGWRTARLCAIDTYVDCPYYERLQYVGDTRIQALISLYVSGDDRLMRNAIELYDRSRVPEGLTQSRYPSASAQVINTFSLFWVDMLHDYWRHRGDEDFLRARLTGLHAVLGWFERKIDSTTGLLGPLPYWTFVDWTSAWSWNDELGYGGTPAGAGTGGSTIVTLQYASTLRHATALCEGLGETERAKHYAKIADGLIAAVNRRCWDKGRLLYADTPECQIFSQHANVFAVLSGAVSGDAARDLMQRVADDKSLIQSTTYFRFYLLQAMKEAGLGDRYLEGLGPWREMLARGLTTFAEKPDPTRSDCHAWSASPVYEFLATVCGIEPASPGFATVRVAPHLGYLKWAKGKMPHPRGDIAVELRVEGDKLQAKVTLPEGVSGDFQWHGKVLPLRAGSQALSVP